MEGDILLHGELRTAEVTVVTSTGSGRLPGPEGHGSTCFSYSVFKTQAWGPGGLWPLQASVLPGLRPPLLVRRRPSSVWAGSCGAARMGVPPTPPPSQLERLPAGPGPLAELAQPTRYQGPDG